MFVLSLRASTIKIMAALFALAVIVAAAFWEGNDVLTADKIPAQTTALQNADVSTNAGRIDFLKGYGWNVEENPLEVVELAIPETFDKVYNNYNVLQKSQGYDLSLYRGKRIKRWTYKVTNYPGRNDMRANMLVYNGKVIGGDVSSVAINGFMQGFSKTEANVPTGINTSNTDIAADMLKADAKK